MVEDKPIDFTTLLQMTTETIALAFKRIERILVSHSKRRTLFDERVNINGRMQRLP